jgi:predicted short-subunit dehydrogenase-like oxidoreductase (DUF2520 family)
MKVTLIGSGNTATVLGRRIALAGHEIVQVYSRNREHGSLLADEFGCPVTDAWAEIGREAGLYLVALSDGAIPALGADLSLPGKLVVHTAGAVSKEVLAGITADYGVLYPLQSLRKEIRAPQEIPLLVEGSRPDALERIVAFARTLSQQVREADGETRMKLHLAGVLVNNFSNHLYALTAGYCHREGLPFDLLLPLINETAGRLSHTDPVNAQTGPAVRGDEATIGRHLKMLDNYKDIKDLYKLITLQIKETFRKK